MNQYKAAQNCISVTLYSSREKNKICILFSPLFSYAVFESKTTSALFLQETCKEKNQMSTLQMQA